MNKKIYFGLVCLGLCLEAIGKERDFICNAFPSEKQVQYVYQKCLLNEMFIYDRDENGYVLTDKGKPIYDNLTQLAIDYYKDKKFCFQPALSDLAILYSILIDDAKSFLDNKTGIFVLTYANLNNLQKKDPLPEIFFPVKKEIEDDFCYKSSKEIFESKMEYCFVRPLQCGQQEEVCDISALDQAVVDRLTAGSPEDKAILFVGFDQSWATEGSEIYWNTPGYTRSLFWSLWNERPDENHNAIKFCFCKINDFLAANSQLYNFFDYIIVGGQTIEYVSADAWLALGDMLKKGGRIVYPDMEVNFFPPFLNMMLSECCKKSKGFELYKCRNVSEPIYNEIKSLASFNDEPTYGAVCYTHAKTLYWHKKL